MFVKPSISARDPSSSDLAAPICSCLRRRAWSLMLAAIGTKCRLACTSVGKQSCTSATQRKSKLFAKDQGVGASLLCKVLSWTGSDEQYTSSRCEKPVSPGRTA
eukprot:scaffold1265_cov366-Prasinococcus_capsulatus_cf.AAC.19